MTDSIKKYSDMGHCPIRNVLCHFREYRCLRFSEISRALPDISPKVLSSTLKSLESEGLISRKLYPSVPPKVEYSITLKGDSLIPILNELIDWAADHM